MKQLSTHLMIFAAIALLAVPAFASDNAIESDSTKEMKRQMVCPVMGGIIDSAAYTDIQGQRVYHCCMMCSNKLTNDPDRYFEQAAADGIRFENIQTTCPVSGETLTDKRVSIYYKGRTIKLCCDKCLPTFEKDPQTYFKTMDAAPAKGDAKADARHDMDKM